MDSLTIAIIVLNLSLGFIILIQARKDLSAIIFFLITCSFALLSVANDYSLATKSIALPSLFANFTTISPLYWLRFEMFLAAWHTFLFFVFIHLFTKGKFEYSVKRSLVFLVPFIGILILSLSPYLFSNITFNDLTGKVEPKPGSLFVVYALWLFITMALSMRYAFIMYRKSEGSNRIQWEYLVGGSFTTYLALIIFNFIFAGVLQNTSFLIYTPLFSLPIVTATAYAIIKHNLFNIKVLATQGFVFIISVLYFARLVSSLNNTGDSIINGIIFIATVFFGVLLVRTVKEEVRSREKIQGLAKSLESTNWELAKKNEKLRIIDQRKSEFVSIVSHQLRTPITAMKGYASLLLEGSYGKLTEEQTGAIDRMFTSSQRLATMVSEFLDISKIEQGTMVYNFTPVDFGKMVGELIEEFQEHAKDKKLSLVFTKTDDGPFTVIADEGKIRQIISNVMDNSIKYTPAGGITVSIERDTKQNIIICKLSDTGIGLSQDDIHHLFGKFTRGAGGGKVNTSGSGLGLYVAKKMLEAHKGDIWVDSEGVDKGSVFVITLPAEGSPNAPKEGSITASTTEEGKV